MLDVLVSRARQGLRESIGKQDRASRWQWEIRFTKISRGTGRKAGKYTYNDGSEFPAYLALK